MTALKWWVVPSAAAGRNFSNRHPSSAACSISIWGEDAGGEGQSQARCGVHHPRVQARGDGEVGTRVAHGLDLIGVEDRARAESDFRKRRTNSPKSLESGRGSQGQFNRSTPPSTKAVVSGGILRIIPPPRPPPRRCSAGGRARGGPFQGHRGVCGFAGSASIPRLVRSPAFRLLPPTAAIASSRRTGRSLHYKPSRLVVPPPAVWNDGGSGLGSAPPARLRCRHGDSG